MALFDMMSSCQRCCFFLRSMLPSRFQKATSMPLIRINMYNNDSDCDIDDNEGSSSAECRQLLAASKSFSQVIEDDLESQFLTDDIDEAGLKMHCLDRIRLIKEDMNDPNLTPSERRVNLINLNALNNILTNIRLSEKIKLGSLQNSQYTDAIILQKQVVCNLAGQSEYNDLINPVVLTQPQKSNTVTTSDSIQTSSQMQQVELHAVTDRDDGQTTNEDTSIKSILKPAKSPKNNIKGKCVALSI